ncbi:MAG: DNA translocase FtsK [Acidobacteria bacterium]|nr:DNA translocase FtsK [Acidobacteriota bacterium]
MKFLGPSRHPRLNEVVALVLLFASVALMLSLISYRPEDPSLNTATGPYRPLNLLGYVGSYLSDMLFQVFGMTSFVMPGLVVLLAWQWMQSREIESPGVKVLGGAMFLLGIATALSLSPSLRAFGGHIPAGGLIGLLLADGLVALMNFTGAALFTAACLLVSLYLISTFSMAVLARWLVRPRAAIASMIAWFSAWRMPKIRFPKRDRKDEAEGLPSAVRPAIEVDETPAIVKRTRRSTRVPEEAPLVLDAAPPFEPTNAAEPEFFHAVPPYHEPPPIPVMPPPMPSQAATPEPNIFEEEIPIRTLAELEPDTDSPIPAAPVATRKEPKVKSFWKLPPTELLNPPDERNAFDTAELKETAVRIKAKFEEFNVLGSVVQINPGPVVTTFEFKPEAGIKYSKITTLTEDLCLGLQAESILIERIPGKPTVGIEVPNSRREVISLRQVLESEEFASASSRLVMPLGKDVSGRIKVSSLETMPHLLVAGSTGSGKSVMLNSMIMSILYKSTPEEVRMIMIDPKRVELGIYDNIPHLLTPVITDPKKATNALRNAVLEMERRLKLMAALGVRNIDGYNKKVRQMAAEPRSLFTDEVDPTAQEDLRPLPYILILIDELADLMMLERANVEESVARLAQMARAVGMHLVLATQRPSVDVITGLIKANFPARMSFRVATRVDSRTVLDVMGAEHLLGKGDMLFLPPGSSRLVRMHGAFVTEAEINEVVEFWKRQAAPEYDQTFLLAPPGEDAEGNEEFEEGDEDPMYADAVRVVLEMGKASTSTLQRRLRLGYGRAARILDRMHREGIIGPPDGSRPREVLRAPDWYNQPVG